MTSFQEFSDSVAALKVSIGEIEVGIDSVGGLVASLKGEVASLKEQIASGGVVSQVQLDGLASAVAEIQISADAIKAKAAEILV